MDKFNFWDFGVIDFIDVFLVAILLYYIYKLIKGTVAINIFIGIIIIFLGITLEFLNHTGLKSVLPSIITPLVGVTNDVFFDTNFLMLH